jgi:hypothetical protein
VTNLRYDFPAHGISLEQIDEGIVVSQKGKRYLARRWYLTADLI